MPGMRDQFAHFYMPDEDAIAAAMKTGLVVPDTNILLHLYRFQAAARDELFGALKKASDRLWIPYQIGLEFQRNRLKVMKEQEEYFDTTLKDLHTALEAFRSKVRAFKRRLSLTEGDVQEIEQAISSLDGLVSTEIIKGKESNEVRLKDHASDTVLDLIDALFEDRVGEPMEPKELEEARKEAERRGKGQIPPGYRDREKPDSTGDYLAWRQIKMEAASRKLPLVFITDDTKEDWYRREHGLTLGARYELREEMMRDAGVPLLMMTTETFLRHAKTYLDAEVSDGTVDQARDLTDIYYTGLRHPVNVTRLSFGNTLRHVVLRNFLAQAADMDIVDRMLETMSSGEVHSIMELTFLTEVLAAKLGYSEAVNRIMQATQEAHASGKLTLAQTVDIMDALATYIKQQESQEEPPAEDSNTDREN